MVQIGYGRFWKRWTVAPIEAVLTDERHLPLSERAVRYLIGVWLVVLRCPSPLRVAAHAPSWRRHGLFLSSDALKPEKGNRALYVGREVQFGVVVPIVCAPLRRHWQPQTKPASKP